MNGAGAEVRTRENRFKGLGQSPVSPEMGTRTGEVWRRRVARTWLQRRVLRPLQSCVLISERREDEMTRGTGESPAETMQVNCRGTNARTGNEEGVNR